MPSINKPHSLRDATPSRLQQLHEATLRLLELLATHKLEEDLLQKSIEALTTLIEARYGAIGILDEAGRLRQFVHTGIAPEEAKRIGHLPEGCGLLGAVVHEDQVLRLDDMSKDPRSAGFPPNHPPMKSLLAAPISHQGQVYGRVYLSEKTGGGPFNDSDEILTKHYADALALVLTYHRSQAERRQAEEMLREVAHALSAANGEEFFSNLVLTLSSMLGVDYAFVGEIKPGQPDTIQTIAFCDHGRIVDNIEYHMAPNTPCGSVECKAVCHFPEGARKLFPEDDLIYRYGAEAFIGHPLLDSSGCVLGLLVVMHEKPLADKKEHIQSLLHICANRAVAELEHRRIDQALNEVAQAVSSVTGEEFFRKLVTKIVKALGMDYAFIGELDPRREQAIRTAAVCTHGKIIDNFTYELHGTPCETVVGREFCAYPRNVQQQFPEDHALVEMGVESYMGAPLFDSAGRPIGILVALGSKPATDIRLAEYILKISATRASAELERRRAEETLRDIVQTLSAVTGENFFRELVLNLAQTLRVDHVLVGEPASDAPDAIRTVAYCARGEAGDNFTYNLRGSPCENVLNKQPAYHPRGVQQLFPEDRALADLGVESYMGHPLFDSAGKALGILVVMDGKPLLSNEPAQSILRICAARAAAELERRRSDQSLRESEVRFRATFSQAAVGIAHVAPDGRFLRINQKFCDIVGYTQEEMLRRTFQEITHPDDLNADVEYVRRVLAGEIETYSMEKRYFRKDGSIVWVNLTVSLMRDPQNSPKYFISVVENITARKQAEAEMVKLSSVVEQTADSVAIANRDGIIQYVNPAYEAVTGYTRAEAVGKKMNIVKSGKHDKAFYERLWKTILQGEVFRDRFINRRKDGSLYHEEKTITPLKNEKGDVTHFVSTGKDVTARVQTEDLLSRFGRILDNSSNEIYVFCADSLRFIQVNQGAQRNLGYTLEEMKALTPLDLKPEFNQQSFEALIAPLRRGEQDTAMFETVHKRKDGSLYPVEVRLQLSRNETSPVFFAIIQDITERRHAEEALRASEKRYQTMTEISPVGIFRTDVDGSCLYVNKRWCAIAGLSIEQARGTAWANALHPEDHERVFAEWNRAVNDHALFYAEYRFKRSDGAVTWVLGQARAETDGAGKIIGYVGTITDITERKRAEKALAQSAAEWTYAMDFIEDPICLVDLEDRVMRANQAFYRFTGRTPETTLGHTLTSVMHPHGETIPCPVCQARKERRDAYITREPDDPTNPTGRPTEVTVRMIRNDAGEPTGMLVGIRDLTRTRQAGEMLRESEASLANAQRIAHLGNWDWNIVTNDLRWSDEIYRIYGLTPQQFDATYEAFLNSVHPDDRQAVTEAVNKALNEKAPYSIYHRIVLPDGTERVVHEQAEVTFDENDKPIRMVGTVQDVTEYRRAMERLHYLANYDPLTGLPNRVLLQDRLSLAMADADRRDRLVAVMFLDLDRFKIINDTLGHDVGDALLKEVAGRLTACLRAGDAISRLGGDEFTVILANVAHVDDVSRVAQKIIDSFTPPFQIVGREMFISTSIGITLYPLDDSGIENLMRNADAAMYHAKEMGRNTFQFYTAELNRRTAKRMALETALRHALERNELLLHYQPQVDLKTGRIVGAEALLRWQHPEMGLIPPLDFIPLAEETGLIIPIGEWVLRTACRQAQAWHRAGFPRFQVAVNLSGRQFQHRDLAKLAKKVLKETGLNPRHLDLELTESLLMHNTGETLATMEELHTHGVAFSMDDFGTGYSSLSYLKRFPIDTLKIDQSFVRDIPTDPDDAAIAQAIIAMAHSLGIRVIAEGVETAKQLAFMRAHQCDGMQGYYFSKPVTAEAMTKLLQEDRRLPRRKTAPRGKTNPRKQRSVPGKAR